MGNYDPTCRGATEPACHNYRAHVPQLQSPRALESRFHNYRAHTLWSPRTTTREKAAPQRKMPRAITKDPRGRN